ncbi:Holliday junction branch migration protein RuvA [Candidatus Igneacidithiobacillus taiwanensis]|uniref:Holliday junction branch migration protein RuvA n=1 Tax=Candidatus Igneacidithiobacillus taiwanensis TaxID=1945924 RepID=UPI002899D017|nr:Holliday junction branch migration protein RuvA [Candidatus Igneacidithiobacillus taiwanensis]
MITSLQGKVLQRRPPWLWLDVGGVGYEIEMPLSSFYQLPAEGSPVQVFTHFMVREDAQLLYGFLRLEERELFRLLIKVNGIGGKVALACLAGLDVEQLRQALLLGDKKRLTAIPGIGAKTAERMIVELQDKIGSPGPQSSSGQTLDDPRQEAIAALQSLGYKAAEAQRAVEGLATDLRTEELLRLALQSLARC